MVGRLLKSFFLIIFVDFNDGIPVSFLKKKNKKKEKILKISPSTITRQGLIEAEI